MLVYLSDVLLVNPDNVEAISLEQNKENESLCDLSVSLSCGNICSTKTTWEEIGPTLKKYFNVETV